MVPESTSSTRVGPADRYGSDNTLVNALIGAVVGIVLSFVPLSPLLGGAVAGYLEGGDGGDGLRAGAIAGLVMLLPLVLFGVVAATFFLGFGPGGGAPLAFGLLLVFALLAGAVYTVGLSAAGGYLGVYLRGEWP